MHRFIVCASLLICPIFNGVSGVVYANTINKAEQQWIDAHPIVRFSIHEKYTPYLQADNGKNPPGVFHTLLKKMGELTGQEFIPKWRKNDYEGLRQLANGEVDFMIDPPTFDDEYLKFGSLSEAIFWGHDAILTKLHEPEKYIDPSNIAFFDRGYENPPLTTYPHPNISSNAEKMLLDLLKNDIEALVLPIRLARQLIQQSNATELQIDGLYSREPFEYRWLITHEDSALHGVLNHFLKNLDPIGAGQLFSLGNDSIGLTPQGRAHLWPW